MRDIRPPVVDWSGLTCNDSSGPVEFRRIPARVGLCEPIQRCAARVDQRSSTTVVRAAVACSWIRDPLFNATVAMDAPREPVDRLDPLGGVERVSSVRGAERC